MKRTLCILLLLVSWFVSRPEGRAQDASVRERVQRVFVEAIDSTCNSYINIDLRRAAAWLDMASGTSYDSTSYFITRCLKIDRFIRYKPEEMTLKCDTLQHYREYFAQHDDTLAIFGYALTDWLQGMCNLLANREEALEYFQRSEKLFDSIGRTRQANYCLLMQSETLIAFERMVESNAVARRMLAKSDSLGDENLRFQALEQQLFVYVIVNMTDLANVVRQEIENDGYYKIRPLYQSQFLQHKAYILLGERNYDAAYTQKEKLLMLCEQINNPIETWRTYLLLAKLCMASGRLDEADAYIDKLSEIRPQLGVPPYYAIHSLDHLPILQAQSLFAHGDVLAAKRLIEKTKLPPKLMGSLDHVEPYYGLREAIETTLGNHEKAIHLLRRRNELNDSIMRSNVEIRARDLELVLLNDSTIQNQQAQLYSHQARIEKRRIQTILMVVLGNLLAALGVAGFLLYIRKKHRKATKQKAILHLQLEHEVREQTLELKRRNELLAEENLDTLRSQAYAKHVQKSILPQQAAINEYLGTDGSFVVFQPKGIISGDLYWFRAMKSGRIVVCCADSWGDDVQGAILSTLGITLLNDNVKEDGRYTAAGILNLLNDKLLSIFPTIKTLEGINCSIAIIDPARQIINIALARQKALLSHRGKMTTINGVNRKVGEVEEPFVSRQFEDQNLQYQHGDMLYLFTDGATSCFGGANGEKLKLSGLKKILAESEKAEADKRQLTVKRMFGNWLGENPKGDDITIIGLAL